ncbi:MAG: DUF1573 domain-containing protein [Bacteroidia bacterium]|jgi:hypothetical protein|nr:DUF1573 domain-containing protein [Bacteroidia bacterium]
MKKLIFITTVVTGTIFQSCSNADKGNKLPSDMVSISASADSSLTGQTQGKPIITFEKLDHNFGSLTDGEVVEYTFKFKNTGDADLLIVSASASCGCTVPEYPKELIKPGQDGGIKVKFDSKGKVGPFNKQVTIVCNTEPRDNLISISGEVLETKQ